MGTKVAERNFISILAPPLMGTKLLRDSSINGIINLMNICETSTSEDTEMVNMPLTPLVYISTFPSPNEENTHGTRGSLVTLQYCYRKQVWRQAELSEY